MEQVDQPSLLTLTYDRENGKVLSPPRQRQVMITADLRGAFARAAAVNLGEGTPLSFTSLLIALLTGTDSTSTWVRDHLQTRGVSAQRVAERRSRKFDPQSLESMASSSPLSELAMSGSARQAIEEAQSIAFKLQSGGPLDLRHLAAAYPTLPNWHEADFSALGIDRLEWCRAFGGHMARTFLSEKWYWREYADRASPVPLTSFSADIYTDVDLLGIDRSVDALALLIASTRTVTPLSIGVFGPWGSGKSFFMRHLRKRIWKIAAGEQQRCEAWKTKRQANGTTVEDAPLYHPRIAQVEFNAWHYNEGNLVASLVDHIFRNLEVQPGKHDDLEKNRTAVLLQISGAEIEVEEASTAIERSKQQVERAQEEVERASSEAESARNDVDAKTEELERHAAAAEQVRARLDTAIRDLAAEKHVPDPTAILAVAMRPLTDAPFIADLHKTAQSFAAEVADWRAFAARLFSPLGVAVALLCLATPFVAFVTDYLTVKWAAVASALATAGASLAPMFKFLRERREEFEKKSNELEREAERRRQERRQLLEEEAAQVSASWKDRLEELRTALDGERAALASREEAVAAAARALTERTRDLEQKVQQRVAAEAKLREAQGRLKKLSSALLLDEFIKDRSATDEYRKQLGFLALVRRDFQRLSDLISAANAEWYAPGKPGTEVAQPLLNRIVLYIDDLDRCKVETVLSVLEAVHLLLAFPLFVCVVAVDPRWIEECLREKHRTLFGAREASGNDAGAGDGVENARVTVGDYLEKIFQIPIWTNPIDSHQRATLVKSLLGSTAAPEPPGEGPRAGAAPAPPQPPPLSERAPLGTDSVNGFEAALAKAQAQRDPLRITGAEAQFVDRVAPLLSDRPRALKRFVNTYRLLKASLPDINRQSFVSDDVSSDFRICISQLALFTGHPRLAPILVRQLKQSNGKHDTLWQWFEAQPDPIAKALLKEAIELIPDSAQIRLDSFCSWLPDTTKYLFHRPD